MKENDNNKKETNTKEKQKNEAKKVKKINKQLDKASKGKKVKIKKERKLVYAFETAVVVLLAVVMLILLCNRTFFRENYKTSKIDLDIPLLTFFVKDEDGEIVFKTLRKSEYVRNYFEANLVNLTKYNCGNDEFYYDEQTRTAIYDIVVEKKFVIKTIKVKYAYGDADCLCNSGDNCK